MRRFALVVGIVAALGLGTMPSAVAANPGVMHFAFTEPITDSDFCGTGQTVETLITVKGTVFLSPNQPVDSRTVSQVNVVFTNPENQATVIRHAAGPVSDTTISGDPDGLHTVETTVRGLVGHLRTADGVVLLGAGYLTLHEVFNGEEFISREIIISKGPHPNAESDLALFCEVTTAALGLN